MSKRWMRAISRDKSRNVQPLSWEQVPGNETSTYASRMSRSVGLILSFWSPTSHWFSVGCWSLFLGSAGSSWATCTWCCGDEMNAKGTSPVLLSNYSPTAAEGQIVSAIRDVCRLWSGLRFPKEAHWPELPPKLNIHLLNQNPNLVFCSCIYLLAAMKQTQSHENARKQRTQVEFFCYLLICMLIRAMLKLWVWGCWWVKRTP